MRESMKLMLKLVVVARRKSNRFKGILYYIKRKLIVCFSSTQAFLVL